MAKLHNETVGRSDYDNLIVDINPPADVVAVKLAAGTYERGTIITGTAGGNLAKLAAAVDGTKATFVLCDNVAEAEAGEVSFAYRSGHFNAGALKTDGYELTAADKEALRKSGIFVSDAM